MTAVSKWAWRGPYKLYGIGGRMAGKSNNCHHFIEQFKKSLKVVSGYKRYASRFGETNCRPNDAEPAGWHPTCGIRGQPECCGRKYPFPVPKGW